jgi:hypothetical protein
VSCERLSQVHSSFGAPAPSVTGHHWSIDQPNRNDIMSHLVITAIVSFVIFYVTALIALELSTTVPKAGSAEKVQQTEKAK